MTVEELLDPAQTNLRLYEQLRRERRDDGELAAVRRAYDLAVRLFAGLHRASGKPFIAHVVGTASILARLGAGGDVVVAGLLHAAYSHGQFAGIRRALTGRKRAAVEGVVGRAAEALIFRYAKLPWNAATADRFTRLGVPAEDRDVVAMRLANALEDLVDLAPAYSAKRDAPGDLAALESELCTRLGYPALAEALARARREAGDADVPAPLRTERDASFVVAPATHRPRIEVRAARWLAGQVRRWLR